MRVIFMPPPCYLLPITQPIAARFSLLMLPLSDDITLILPLRCFLASLMLPWRLLLIR